MKILVTSPWTPVSQAVLASATAAGHVCRVGTDARGSGQDAPPAGAETVQIAWDNDASLRDACSGCDGVVLVLPFAHAAHVAADCALVARVAAEAGVKSLVYLSTMAPTEPFVQAEDALIASPVASVTVVRPNLSFQHFVSSNRWSIDGADSAIYLSWAKAAVSLVDARDVADVAVAALAATTTGNVITVTGPDALTGSDIAATLSASVGKDVFYRAITNKAARHGMTARYARPCLLAASLLPLASPPNSPTLAPSPPAVAWSLGTSTISSPSTRSAWPVSARPSRPPWQTTRATRRARSLRTLPRRTHRR